MRDYAQGWEQIVKNLTERWRNLPNLGHIHPFIKYVRDAPITNNWQNEYTVLDPETNKRVVCCTLINRSGPPYDRVSLDDLNRFTRQHQVEIFLYREFQDQISWPIWQRMLDDISTDLRDGDQTINKSCLTYGVQQPGDSLVQPMCGVTCHSSIIKLTIEEA